MITVPEAVKRLKKRHPDVVVKKAAVLSEDFYIFLAPVKGVKDDFNDPYYLVDTDEGEVYTFSPVDYMDDVIDAFENRRINLKKVMRNE